MCIAYKEVVQRLTSDPEFRKATSGGQGYASTLVVPGMTKLGYGVFGAVFAASSDSPTVLKLGFIRSDPYPYYLEWVLKCAPKANPAFPQVHMLSIGEGYYAAEIECLRESGMEHQPGSRQPFHSFALGYLAVPEEERSSGQQRGVETLAAAPQYLKDASALLFSEGRAYVEHHMQRSVRNDLHWGNVMMRGDQYVITDPFADD